MKRFISILMAAVVLVTTVFAAGVYSGAEMLDGEEGIDYVEALYFDNAPVIDGYITEAEWGSATVHIQNDWCATIHDQAPYYNSFFYWKQGTIESNPMEADIWLRWDEEHYYVGVKVKDYDGHSLAHNKSETWNGDAIQFRVDCEGANSATGGIEYDPSLGTPWLEPDVVPDFVVGYTQVAGGYFECYESTNDISLTYYDMPVFGEALAVVSPSETHSDAPANYHGDSINGYTTYEVAIPWKYIFENHLVPNAFWLPEEDFEPYILDYSEYNFRNNPKGGIGYTLGMSLTVFNAQANQSTWKSFMSWGSGTTNVQTSEAHQTCAGSNSVTLSAEKVSRGSFATYDPSILEAEEITVEYDSVFYDYLADDLGENNPIESYDELMSLTYDDPSHMDFWGSRELYQGSLINSGDEHGLVLNYDRMLETKVDEWGYIKYEGIDAIDQFYIDTRLSENAKLAYPLSYTFDFDIMYTGNEVVQKDKPSRLGLWFGGADGYSYYCGYSFEYEAFVISKSMGDEEILYIGFADFEKNQWSNWKFQYDNDTYTVRFYVDDKLVFNVSDRNFYYSDKDMQEDGAMLIMWFLNTQMRMDNVKIYNFYDYVKNPVGGTHSVSGKVNSFGEETELTAYLIDIYTGEILQSTTMYGNAAEYKFDDVANGDYLIYIEKYKHIGTYTFAFVDGEPVVAEEVILYLIGDADNDGSVTASDIVEVIYAMKDESLYSEYCDVDGDYAITASDITAVINIMKGRFIYPPENVL